MIMPNQLMITLAETHMLQFRPNAMHLTVHTCMYALPEQHRCVVVNDDMVRDIGEDRETL